MEKQKFVDVLKEQLQLAGIPLEEEQISDNALSEAPKKELPPMPDEEEPFGPEPEEEPKAKPEKEEPEEEPEPEEELADKWEIDIKTSSKFKFEMHENYIYVWYRNKRSDKIQIPTRLRGMRKLVSELFNKILSHVEKVS